MSITSTVTMGEREWNCPQIAECSAGWSGRRIEPAGRPFPKYHVIDMVAEVEVDVSTATLVDGDSRVDAHVLPGGSYVFAQHVGYPDHLVNATRDLLAWADDQGVAFDVAGPDAGERWAARLEAYLSDPDTEPDLNRWKTNLFFRLAP